MCSSLCLSVSQSLDELDDDDGGDKAKEEEQQLTQLNTEQNEAMTSDPGAATHLLQVRTMSPNLRAWSIA